MDILSVEKIKNKESPNELYTFVFKEALDMTDL